MNPEKSVKAVIVQVYEVEARTLLFKSITM